MTAAGSPQVPCFQLAGLGTERESVFRFTGFPNIFWQLRPGHGPQTGLLFRSGSINEANFVLEDVKMSELTPAIPDLNSGEESIPNQSNSDSSKSESNSPNLNSDNSNSPKSRRGGARKGAGRPRKNSKQEQLSPEDLVPILEKQIQSPNTSPRDRNASIRKLALLKKWEQPYDRRPVAQRQPPEPPKPVSQPLWMLRGTLVEQVANRFLEPYLDCPDPYALELVLLPDEVEAGAQVTLTPEKLLTFVREFIWNHAHPDELRALEKSFIEDDPEILAGVSPNEPEYLVLYLKAYPRVFVNSGRTLTQAELEDVLITRANSAATKEKIRRDLYEKYPDRFLHGYKTVEEYDARHPGESILKRRVPRYSHELWQ